MKKNFIFLIFYLIDFIKSSLTILHLYRSSNNELLLQLNGPDSISFENIDSFTQNFFLKQLVICHALTISDLNNCNNTIILTFNSEIPQTLVNSKMNFKGLLYTQRLNNLLNEISLPIFFISQTNYESIAYLLTKFGPKELIVELTSFNGVNSEELTVLLTMSSILCGLSLVLIIIWLIKLRISIHTSRIQKLLSLLPLTVFLSNILFLLYVIGIYSKSFVKTVVRNNHKFSYILFFLSNLYYKVVDDLISVILWNIIYLTSKGWFIYRERFTDSETKVFRGFFLFACIAYFFDIEIFFNDVCIIYNQLNKNNIKKEIVSCILYMIIIKNINLSITKLRMLIQFFLNFSLQLSYRYILILKVFLYSFLIFRFLFTFISIYTLSFGIFPSIQVYLLPQFNSNMTWIASQKFFEFIFYITLLVNLRPRMIFYESLLIIIRPEGNLENPIDEVNLDYKVYQVDLPENEEIASADFDKPLIKKIEGDGIELRNNEEQNELEDNNPILIINPFFNGDNNINITDTISIAYKS